MEHLLRDVKDTTISTLATEVCFKSLSLSLSLNARCLYLFLKCLIFIGGGEGQNLKFLMSCTGDWETDGIEGFGCPA